MRIELANIIHRTHERDYSVYPKSRRITDRMKRRDVIRELKKMGVCSFVMAQNMIGTTIPTHAFLSQFLATESLKILWQSTFSRCSGIKLLPLSVSKESRSQIKDRCRYQAMASIDTQQIHLGRALYLHRCRSRD